VKTVNWAKGGVFTFEVERDQRPRLCSKTKFQTNWIFTNILYILQINRLNKIDADVKLLIVICISRPRNHSLTYREKKLSPRPLAAEADNLKDVYGFRGQGVHNRKI
jgi:hypothetical protein